MPAMDKLEILRSVETSGLPVRQALERLAVPPSTYYRWRNRFRREGTGGLVDRSPFRGRVWNQILPEERSKVVEVALLFPERSPREIAWQVSDSAGFTVSESTVYRVLKAAGLVPPLV